MGHWACLGLCVETHTHNNDTKVTEREGQQAGEWPVLGVEPHLIPLLSLHTNESNT